MPLNISSKIFCWPSTCSASELLGSSQPRPTQCWNHPGSDNRDITRSWFTSVQLSVLVGSSLNLQPNSFTSSFQFFSDFRALNYFCSVYLSQLSWMDLCSFTEAPPPACLLPPVCTLLTHLFIAFITSFIHKVKSLIEHQTFFLCCCNSHPSAE